MDDAQVDGLLRQARQRGLRALDEPTGKRLLEACGIRVPRSIVLELGGDAAEAVSGMTGPLAVKVMAADILHKSDIGGVCLNLRDGAEVARAIAEMSAAMQQRCIAVQGWLVEEMAPPGVEVVVGGTIDPEFGPLVMVGLGGVFVEILQDVAFRICPIDRLDARGMLDELRGAALLRGARGKAPVNVDAIVDVLLRVGGENGLLLRGAGNFAEVDINPLIVSPEAAVAVDARFVLQA